MKVPGPLEAWETDYRKRGRVWGGTAQNLPDIPPGSRVLELGCGNGKTFAALLERGCDTVGIDFSRNAVVLCSRSFGTSSQSHVVVAEAQNLPFADGSFDAVVAYHVAGHLDSCGRIDLSREAQRAVHPGGNLWFSGFSVGDFRAAKGTVSEPGTVVKKNGIATHYFTKDEVIRLFSGFSCQDCGMHRWYLTVRGRNFLREEIIARFTKNG
ncbi:MAG: class I SAM-dependent methyltransferase [Methanoregula sp.]